MSQPDAGADAGSPTPTPSPESPLQGPFAVAARVEQVDGSAECAGLVPPNVPAGLFFLEPAASSDIPTRPEASLAAQRLVTRRPPRLDASGAPTELPRWLLSSLASRGVRRFGEGLVQQIDQVTAQPDGFLAISQEHLAQFTDANGSALGMLREYPYRTPFVPNPTGGYFAPQSFQSGFDNLQGWCSSSVASIANPDTAWNSRQLLSQDHGDCPVPEGMVTRTGELLVSVEAGHTQPAFSQWLSKDLQPLADAGVPLSSVAPSTAPRPFVALPDGAVAIFGTEADGGTVLRGTWAPGEDFHSAPEALGWMTPDQVLVHHGTAWAQAASACPEVSVALRALSGRLCGRVVVDASAFCAQLGRAPVARVFADGTLAVETLPQRSVQDGELWDAVQWWPGIFEP